MFDRTSPSYAQDFPPLANFEHPQATQNMFGKSKLLLEPIQMELKNKFRQQKQL